MTENRSYLQKYAMHFGTYMGIYWILKFILFPLGLHIPFLSILFVFSAGSCGSLRLFPIHRSWIYHQLLHPVVGRTDDQHPGSDRKQRSYKRNDRYRPFTYFHQYHHATIVMGCILGKYPGHSHRIDGNEKGQTGK